MYSTTDVVIAGGGVIGCAIAYHLRKLGVDVIVLERGEIGAEASSAAAGLLAPLGPLSGPGAFADLVLTSFALMPTLVSELEDASAMRLEYERPGSLRVVRDSKHIANLRKRMQAWQPLGLQMQWFTGEEARQREPLLSPDICAAVYAPEESQIKAPHVVKAFSVAAAKRGAVLRGHSEIMGVQRNHARVTGVYTSEGETIGCEHLVVATGAWATRSGVWLNVKIPVSPQRGQILSLRQPALPLRHIIFGEAVYLASKSGNTLLVGATKEEVGFDKQLTAGGVAWLLNTAVRLAPSLENSAIDQMWAGLRPRTPDNQPILGPAPGWENVTLAIGHGSTGILLSAITGKAIAELVVEGKAPEVILPFSMERFEQPI
jgi:glycine oxidase